jgi:Cytochrome c554 and c-prime
MRENKYKTVGSWLRILLVLFTVFAAIKIASAQQEKPLDPKAWGSNNVGKGVPEFIHGDECLFCHRTNIGLNWVKNSHAKDLRQIEDAPDLEALLKLHDAKTVKEITYFLGARNQVRFLKKDGYGKFAMLEAKAKIDKDQVSLDLMNSKNPGWDKEKFANQCVGCHSTGIDEKTKTFSGFGLDCYTCHGAPSIDHTNDTSLMILSKKRRNEAQIITSLCAQCHLRGGKSKSTGLPYPNTFVAGDNLFQDYEIDWKKADDEKLDPLERHIYRNVRDVAVDGKNSTTCISCHQVHYDTKEKSVLKHQGVPPSKLCSDCHLGESPTNAVKKFVRTSKVCEY